MEKFAVRVSLLLALLALVGGAAPAGAGPVPPATPVRPAPVHSFRWPLDGPPRLVRPFDPPPQPWSPGHRGIDLAAPPGSVVRAAGSGVVYFAGRIAGRGVVSVAHPGGLRTTYEPVEPQVAAGDRLSMGDPIGVLAAGHEDCVAGCLHWGLRRGEAYLDPLTLLGLGRVRLLPTESTDVPTAQAYSGRAMTLQARGGRAPTVQAQTSPDRKSGSRWASRSYSSGSL